MFQTTLAPGYTFGQGWPVPPPPREPKPVKPEPTNKDLTVSTAPQSVKSVAERKATTLEFLHFNPGATVAQLKPVLGMEDSGVGRILRRLRFIGRVKRVQWDGVWTYYLIDTEELPPREKRKHILIEALEKHPGAKLTDLARLIAVDPTSTQGVLSSLIKQGKVKRSWIDQRWFYEVVR